MQKPVENVMAIFSGLLAVPLSHKCGFGWMPSGVGSFILAIVTGAGGYIGKEFALWLINKVNTKIKSLKQKRIKK